MVVSDFFFEPVAKTYGLNKKNMPVRTNGGQIGPFSHVRQVKTLYKEDFRWQKVENPISCVNFRIFRRNMAKNDGLAELCHVGVLKKCFEEVCIHFSVKLCDFFTYLSARPSIDHNSNNLPNFSKNSPVLGFSGNSEERRLFKVRKSEMWKIDWKQKMVTIQLRLDNYEKSCNSFGV